MRKVAPSLATLGLVGAITAHQGWQKLLTEKDPSSADDEQALSNYAALWLNGLLPGIDGAVDPDCLSG